MDREVVIGNFCVIVVEVGLQTRLDAGQPGRFKEVRVSVCQRAISAHLSQLCNCVDVLCEKKEET